MLLDYTYTPSKAIKQDEQAALEFIEVNTVV